MFNYLIFLRRGLGPKNGKIKKIERIANSEQQNYRHHIHNSVSTLIHVFWPGRDSCSNTESCLDARADISLSRPVVKGLSRSFYNFKTPVLLLFSISDKEMLFYSSFHPNGFLKINLNQYTDLYIDQRVYFSVPYIDFTNHKLKHIFFPNIMSRFLIWVIDL